MSKCTSFVEAVTMYDKAAAERKGKREEIERLTAELLTYDSTNLGDAVKCYISEAKDTSRLTDTAYRAYQSIAEILILEMEC